MSTLDSNIKSAFVNAGWLTVLQIASYFFPLITLPYLARVIGANGFGKIAFASAIIVWFQTIVDWGFNFTAARDVARIRDDKNKVSELISNVFWVRITLMMICLVLLLGFIFFIDIGRTHRDVLLVTFMLVPGYILFPEWFFQALEKMKYITIITIFTKIFFLACVFIFIKSPDDYIYQPLFISLGYLLSGIISCYIIFRVWGYKMFPFDIRSGIKLLNNSKDVFINNLMPNLYNSLSIIILGTLCGNVATGKLDGASKLVTVGQQINHIISRAFFPVLSRKIELHNFFVKINIWLAAILSVCLFVLSQWIVDVFLTTQFQGATLALRILSISIFFMALNGTYGTNYMIIIGKDKALKNITAFCCIIGLIASYPLISIYSYIGAAIVISGTRGLMGISVWIYSKYYKAKNNSI